MKYLLVYFKCEYFFEKIQIYLYNMKVYYIENVYMVKYKIQINENLVD